MLLGEPVMSDKFAKGLAVGVVVAVGAALYGSSVIAAARPWLRRGMKTAAKGYLTSRERAAEFFEMAEDAVAEAMSELKEEAKTATAAAAEEIRAHAGNAKSATEASVERKKA